MLGFVLVCVGNKEPYQASFCSLSGQNFVFWTVCTRACVFVQVHSQIRSSTTVPVNSLDAEHVTTQTPRVT